MNRRDLLKASGAGILGANVLAEAVAAPAARLTALVADMPGRLPVEPKRPLPINRQRAYEVLDRLGIDGIVTLRPHNVYYLSNAWPVATQFGVEFPALATFARAPDQPSFFIGTTGSSWDLVNGECEIPEIISYSGPANWHDYIDATPAQMKIEPKATPRLMNSAGFAVKPDGPFSDREAAWKRAQDSYGATASPSIAWGLVRALKASGLAHGRIAVDDMRIAWLLQSIGYDSVTIVPNGDNILREIRLIKQPHEIALMRKAQFASQAAARAACHALEPGMRYADARMRFIAEAASHGAEIAFMLLGVTQGLLPDDTVREGRSYMIDCGAYYQHYMGDFARTISIGEPSATLKTRFRAQQIGRQVALEQIRPGVPFAVIEKAAREAMVKAGMPSDVIAACVLHSVGLQHDDQPTRSDVLPFYVRQDMVVEQDMVVTLDLPFMEIGWGAGHNEDLLHITATGYELMNSADEPLIVV